MQEVTSKDVVKSLVQMREAQLRSFVASDEQSLNPFIASNSSNESTVVNYLQNKLYPEKTVVSQDELQPLVVNDELNLSNVPQIINDNNNDFMNTTD